MVANKSYFPILKSKQGEFNALGGLREDTKEALIPTIDITPNKSTVRTFGQHLDKICEHIASKWGGELPIAFDLFDIQPDQRTEKNEHPATHFFRSAHAAGLRVIPCCGLDRDTAYENAIAKIVPKAEASVIMRLQREDLHAPTIAIPRLQELLAKFGTSTEYTTVLIDLREVHDSYTPLLNPLQNLIDALMKMGIWNELVVAGSAMPKSVAAKIPQSSQGFVVRTEEQLWRDLNDQIDGTVRFGDYTVVNPEYVDLVPRIFANTMGPSIRYTTDDAWLIARGSSFQKHPKRYGQYYDLAQIIQSSPIFKGADYSSGDEYIADRAAGNGTTGNPGTWLSAGINHHIVAIVEKLTEG